MALFEGAKNDMQTEMQNSSISAYIKKCPENVRKKTIWNGRENGHEKLAP